jgi:hypothetical protein
MMRAKWIDRPPQPRAVPLLFGDLANHGWMQLHGESKHSICSDGIDGTDAANAMLLLPLASSSSSPANGSDFDLTGELGAAIKILTYRGKGPAGRA